MNLFSENISKAVSIYLKAGIVSFITVTLASLSIIPAQADETCM
jgi:hypothetical protein